MRGLSFHESSKIPLLPDLTLLNVGPSHACTILKKSRMWQGLLQRELPLFLCLRLSWTVYLSSYYSFIYLSIYLFISAGNSRYFRNPHKAKIITQTLFVLTSEFPAFPRLLIIVGLTKVHTGNHIKQPTIKLSAIYLHHFSGHRAWLRRSQSQLKRALQPLAIWELSCEITFCKNTPFIHWHNSRAGCSFIVKGLWLRASLAPIY